MSIRELEEQVIQLKHRKPFRPFEVELNDGQILQIRKSSLCINETGAGYLSKDDGIVDFNFADVRELRPLKCKDKQCRVREPSGYDATAIRQITPDCFGTCGRMAMKTQEFEEQIIQFIHQKPFRPFAVEMSDGRIVEVKRPSLVINGGGAGYFSEDEEIVDIEFNEIRSLSPLKRKAKR